MVFLIEKFWAPLLIAAILGICIGWITCDKNGSSRSARWIAVAAAAFVGAAIAALQLGLPGRPALWLETGLMTVAAYVVGCCLGCATRALLLGSEQFAEAAVVVSRPGAETPDPSPQPALNRRTSMVVRDTP